MWRNRDLVTWTAPPPPGGGGFKRVESVEIKNSDGKELTFLNIKDRTAIWGETNLSKQKVGQLSVLRRYLFVLFFFLIHDNTFKYC